MEARNITIISTKNSTKKVIVSEAETLGQLKQELIAAGIDFADMTFYEGVSKTELRHDDSILPTNVPYTNRRTGETINTNELVFMLTNQNKKIKSGACAYDRKECYDIIRNLGFQEEVKAAFGKNFTLCTTEQLVNFINDNTETVEEDDEEAYDCGECENCSAMLAIKVLAETLYENECIDSDTLNTVLGILDNEEIEDNDEGESPYSDEELAEMIKESEE